MQKDFRLFLLEQFESRQRTEPTFSIRAFAKTLQIDQSLLTKIMSGKRKISEKTVCRLAEPLKLSSNQVAEFVAPSGDAAKSCLPANQLTEDDVQTLAEWYHFAILELLQIENFEGHTSAISKRLGLGLSETEFALETLLQRGLIEEAEGKYRATTTNNNWMTKDFTAPARKRLQKQFLEKAGHALHRVDISRRENTSLTLAVNRSNLNEFRKIIQTCKDSLRALAEQKGSYDDVYQLVVGFYPLTEMGDTNS